MELRNIADALLFFMKNLLSPICFLVILLVQWKIIRALRTEMNLIMFYGKHVEELRKMMAGGGQSRRLPEIPPDETGLYEVLKE